MVIIEYRPDSTSPRDMLHLLYCYESHKSCNLVSHLQTKLSIADPVLNPLHAIIQTIDTLKCSTSLKKSLYHILLVLN